MRSARGAAIVRVKICGVTNWPDAKLAVDLGADALGFNFYPPSPRSVSPAAAWDIIRRLPPMVTAVGVFVNWPAEVVAALAGALQLGAVQLHGDEPPSEAAALAGAFRVIKAFAVTPKFPRGDARTLSCRVGFFARRFSRGPSPRHGKDGGLAGRAAGKSLR